MRAGLGHIGVQGVGRLPAGITGFFSSAILLTAALFARIQRRFIPRENIFIGVDVRLECKLVGGGLAAAAGDQPHHVYAERSIGSQGDGAVVGLGQEGNCEGMSDAAATSKPTPVLSFMTSITFRNGPQHSTG